MGVQTHVPEPVCLSVLSGSNIVAIAANDQNVGALSADGLVYLWGRNDDRALGLGIRGDVFTPTPVEKLAGHHIKSITCGYRSTFAIMSSYLSTLKLN